MVTMPSEAAGDYTLVSDLLQQGMNCMRINCAHDGPAEWARMVAHLRRAEERLGKSCRILMDLAGPKVRTGELQPGPPVLKFRPKRDSHGRVLEPARVWLFAEDQRRASPTPADASLPVPGAWLRKLAQDDHIEFVDARGASRVLRVIASDAEGCWVESNKTCYVESGTLLRRAQDDETTDDGSTLEAAVGALPAREVPIALSAGDELVVTRSTVAGKNAVCDDRGHVLIPATIGCTADQVFEDVETGDRIWFDDGRIGGIVERRERDRLHARITRAPGRGARLETKKASICRIPS